ncbi:DUF1045 domain-containing protein [Lacimonas salitolerans]|uniref:DUF1045 domain-containing protein n=1 Tax=Lacimonas salitolerans TaxID=1323750 RepID=A0ABW4EBU1_9RHOB
MSFTRFAIYFLPGQAALAGFGAAWLGWDVQAAQPVPQPEVPDLESITATPAKYGFHGTLKPPFRLADGQDQAALEQAAADLAATIAPAQADGLELTRLGGFLALVPVGDTAGIARVAAACVEGLDRFRAPATLDELARRRKSGLSPEQDALLTRWGYPYVMEQFRFHLTLTGPLPKGQADHWLATAQAHLPPLPPPFVMDAVALVGERADGRFELIQNYALSG